MYSVEASVPQDVEDDNDDELNPPTIKFSSVSSANGARRSVDMPQDVDDEEESDYGPVSPPRRRTKEPKPMQYGAGGGMSLPYDDSTSEGEGGWATVVQR